MNMTETSQRIETIRKKLGSKLLILGHHYQSEDVIRHTDLRGDSFQLSVAAAENTQCEAIVFCGVHFMAETADILANRPERLAQRGGKRVAVVLPDSGAGCDMADLANIEQVQRCWDEISGFIDTNDITPITYVNSTAELKAFCGRHGGIACTSSNAETVLNWALERRGRILFFPDQHLGRNTALKMGVSESAMPIWNPKLPQGGLTPEEIRGGKVILWDGHCYVHQKFTPEQIDAVRKKYPDVKVIVHLECSQAVVAKADFGGSTNLILQQIRDSVPGSCWAVATEGKMVQRLIAEFPDKTIVNLAPEMSFCETMNKTTPENLLFALECIAAGRPNNVVQVPPTIAQDALICLQRMLAAQP